MMFPQAPDIHPMNPFIIPENPDWSADKTPLQLACPENTALTPFTNMDQAPLREDKVRIIQVDKVGPSPANHVVKVAQALFKNTIDCPMAKPIV
jgi:hypothetical protein